MNWFLWTLVALYATSAIITIWVTGKNMYEDGLTRYGNGTLVATFKRKAVQ
jgi:hypothetical protein